MRPELLERLVLGEFALDMAGRVADGHVAALGERLDRAASRFGLAWYRPTAYQRLREEHRWNFASCLQLSRRHRQLRAGAPNGRLRRAEQRQRDWRVCGRSRPGVRSSRCDRHSSAIARRRRASQQGFARASRRSTPSQSPCDVLPDPALRPPYSSEVQQ